jgi:hypothetical protein
VMLMFFIQVLQGGLIPEALLYHEIFRIFGRYIMTIISRWED